MYCGDETGAFVGDCGSTTSRYGYGGFDCPKLVLPSCVTSDFSTFPTSTKSPSNDIIHIFEQPKTCDTIDPDAFFNDGRICSFDAWEASWEKSFQTLRVRDRAKQNLSPLDGKNPHPVLAIESSHSSDWSQAQGRRQREKMTEILFEKFDSPAVFIAPAPMLQAFSMGRQTALVVDCGGGGCRATPVIDGLILRNAQRRNGRGGDWLGNVQLQMLRQKAGISVVHPRYACERKAVKYPTGDRKHVYHGWALRETMYEMKTGWHVKVPQFHGGQVVMEGFGDEEKEKDAEKTEYELPDGTKINLLTCDGGKELCALPNLLFLDEPLKDTDISLDSQPQHQPNNNQHTHSHTLKKLSLQKLAHESISSVDPDARKELCNNIILCGAHSLFPGMEERFSAQMSELCPSTFKTRIIAPKNSVERRFASWIGGSIITSLGSFQQLWLSRAEYEEYGVTMGTQRFP